MKIVMKFVQSSCGPVHDGLLSWSCTRPSISNKSQTILTQSCYHEWWKVAIMRAIRPFHIRIQGEAFFNKLT